MQAALPEFEEAIAELERRARDFLTGPGRVRCLKAFSLDPEAFRFLVDKTLKRSDARSLLGLFVRIVDEEHATVSRRLRERPAPTGPTVCPECEIGGGLHSIDCSQANGRAA
ncbi:MAG: hypothetical protein QOG85_153 [Gaiellaceae bacterium]|nr:hypothetical protein [Gaiellaceae bacterium]